MGFFRSGHPRGAGRLEHADGEEADGPAPYTRSGSAIGPASAVCAAFPTDRASAISSGMSGWRRHTFSPGHHEIAKAPARSPRDLDVLQDLEAAWQAYQMPRRCGSRPVPRPRARPACLASTDSTTREFSSPERGAGMRDAAHGPIESLGRCLRSRTRGRGRRTSWFRPRDWARSGRRPGPGAGLWIAHTCPFVTIGSFEVVTARRLPLRPGRRVVERD